LQKSWAEEVNHVRLREPDSEQPHIREEIQITQAESNTDLLYSVTSNWVKNECGRVSQRDHFFTGMSCPNRTANPIFPLAISYTMSGVPRGSLDKHTGKSVMSSMCPHGWQEKIWCLEGLWTLCSLATNPGAGADCCHQPRVTPRRQDGCLLKGTARQARLGSHLACPHRRRAALQNVLPPACSTSLVPLPKSQPASEWFGREWSW